MPAQQRNPVSLYQFCSVHVYISDVFEQVCIFPLFFQMGPLTFSLTISGYWVDLGYDNQEICVFYDTVKNSIVKAPASYILPREIRVQGKPVGIEWVKKPGNNFFLLLLLNICHRKCHLQIISKS